MNLHLPSVTLDCVFLDYPECHMVAESMRFSLADVSQ